MKTLSTKQMRRWLTAALVVTTTCQFGCSATGSNWRLPTLSWPSEKKAAPPMTGEQTSLSSPAWNTKAKAPTTDDSEKPNLSSMMANGSIQEKAGEWEKARAIYVSAQKNFPNAAGPYHRLGVVADQQRRYLEAEQMFAEAIQRDPRNAEQFNDLGYCFFLQGQLNRAESAMLKATELAPKNARFQNNYAMVLAHQGRVDEALNRFRQAGSEADAQYNLAFIYASQEKINEAKTCFRRALAADAQHDAARKALQSFELYDQMPADQRNVELAGSGQRWVPYREPGEPGAAAQASGETKPAIQQASHTTSMSGPQRSAGNAAKAQHVESRGLLNQNMAGQREATRVEQGSR